jgi:dTDP-4-dehydrorhamnose reductase
MKTCLIVGGTGLLGPYLRDAAEKAGWQTVLLGRRRGDIRADITDADRLAQAVAKVQPALVIHAAAVTNVDACEQDPAAARALNADSVASLTWAMPPDSRLVYLSTDQVYPDTKGEHEEDGVGPVNVYGRTKLDGETNARTFRNHLILRVNFFGPSRTEGRSSLSDFVIASLHDRREITLFEDSIFSPLHVETLAKLTIMAAGTDTIGTYNLGCRDGDSKAAFGLAIARHLGLQTETATVGPSKTMPNRARRTADLRMSVDRFEGDFGVALPTLDEEIEKLSLGPANENNAAEADFLPYGRQMIDDADIAAVINVLKSDWLTTGPEIAALEAEFVERLGAGRAVACSSGTAALHLAFMACGLGPGDIVLVPSVTFLASANMARLTGADVVLVDVDPDTGISAPEHYLAAAGALDTEAQNRIKAIAPMAMAGVPAHPEALWSLAQSRGWALIEDACHALGSEYGDNAHRVGSCDHATASTFSLHPVKTIAAGEGGIVTTADPDLADKLIRLRNHGVTREEGLMADKGQAVSSSGDLNPWYYEMIEPGMNYRLTDIQATLARSQFRKLDEFIDRRRYLSGMYRERLSAFGDAVTQQTVLPNTNPAWHLFAALIDFAAIGRDRAGVMAGLRESGVGSQVHYIPLHRQPYFQRMIGNLILPGADGWYDRELSLPLYPMMRDADIDRVVRALERAIA